jgi:uncharacterized protein (DUF2252 family)
MFYRWAPPPKADLTGTPAGGLRVRLSGDAHVSNSGASAFAGWRLVFDANDFDETLRIPFEWELIGRRRWLKRQPGAFAGTIQLTAPALGRGRQ